VVAAITDAAIEKRRTREIEEGPVIVTPWSFPDGGKLHPVQQS
jgi:hypothetical protein